MKNTVLAIALASIIGTTAVIAATDNPAIGQRVEQIKSEFNLNDQQAQRIQNVLSRAGMSKEEKRSARMEKRMERRLERMKERLGLSDEQTAQMKTIMTEQQAQMKSVREQGRASMVALLTPEQVTQFEAMRDMRKGRGGHGKRHGGHGGKHGYGGGKGGYCNH